MRLAATIIMLKVQIKEIAQTRGLTTAYQLQKAVDVMPSVAARLWKGEFKQISVKTLDKLCTVLDVNAGDLFVCVPDESQKVTVIK